MEHGEVDNLYFLVDSIFIDEFLNPSSKLILLYCFLGEASGEDVVLDHSELGFFQILFIDEIFKIFHSFIILLLVGALERVALQTADLVVQFQVLRLELTPRPFCLASVAVEQPSVLFNIQSIQV